MFIKRFATNLSELLLFTQCLAPDLQSEGVSEGRIVDSLFLFSLRKSGSDDRTRGEVLQCF